MTTKEINPKIDGFLASSAEMTALGHRALLMPDTELYYWPTEIIPELLEDAEHSVLRLSNRDFTTYPNGAAKIQAQLFTQRALKLAEFLVIKVQEYLPSVADGADSFLRDLE